MFSEIVQKYFKQCIVFPLINNYYCYVYVINFSHTVLCKWGSYLNEYPKKFIVDPQYIGLFMTLNGKFVTFLFNKRPK